MYVPRLVEAAVVRHEAIGAGDTMSYKVALVGALLALTTTAHADPVEVTYSLSGSA